MPILGTQYPTFQPAMRIISKITNANPAEVTTTFDHQYLTGTIVRLHIPPGYGIVQANGLYAPIIVTGNTTFTIDIDTTFFDPYTTPTSYPDDMQYPQVTAIGEVNSMLTAAEQNVAPFFIQP